MNRFIIGNWKMNKTSADAKKYLSEFKKLQKSTGDVTIAIAAPFTLLPLLKKELEGTKVKVSAQNVFYEEAGAYTGEISAVMLKEFAEYVIIGHSERRKYFNESDSILNKKIKTALTVGLKVVFCVGEKSEERKSGKTKQVIEKQIKEGLLGIADITGLTVAYEPVWAIGTGKNATPRQVQDVHKSIRDLLSKLYGSKTGKSTRIIYGGSVTPENSGSLLNLKDVDGCLPGGASLDPVKFSKIIETAKAR